MTPDQAQQLTPEQQLQQKEMELLHIKAAAYDKGVALENIQNQASQFANILTEVCNALGVSPQEATIPGLMAQKIQDLKPTPVTESGHGEIVTESTHKEI